MTYKFIQNVNSGFFSDFNVIIGCLDFIIKNQIKNFNFIWNNVRYQSSEENLFNKFFFKTDEHINYDHEIAAISIGATYYQPFNEHDKFINSFNVLKHFNYFDNTIYLQLLKECIKAEDCIGVHVRGTDHWQHGPLIDLNVYFKYIDEKILTVGYKNIFLATDQEQYVDKFRERYGEKVIINENITRSRSEAAIHCSGFSNKSKLITDVMLDAISLAQCKEIIITSSNVSAYTLAINPSIKYTFIDRPY